MSSLELHPLLQAARRAYNTAQDASDKIPNARNRRFCQEGVDLQDEIQKEVDCLVAKIENAISEIIKIGQKVHALPDDQMSLGDRDNYLGNFVTPRLKLMKQWLQAVRPESEFCA